MRPPPQHDDRVHLVEPVARDLELGVGAPFLAVLEVEDLALEGVAAAGGWRRHGGGGGGVPGF